MFDLRTHIHKTASDGTPYLVTERPYRRVSVAGYPPVFVRDGKVYYENGDVVGSLPDVYREVLPELFPTNTPREPIDKYELRAQDLRRYMRQRITVNTKPSERFLHLDNNMRKCKECGEIVHKNQSGIHVLKNHKTTKKETKRGAGTTCD